MFIFIIVQVLREKEKSKAELPETFVVSRKAHSQYKMSNIEHNLSVFNRGNWTFSNYD